MYNYNRLLKLLEIFYLIKDYCLLKIGPFLGKKKARVAQALFNTLILIAYYRYLSLNPRRFGQSFTFDIIM